MDSRWWRTGALAPVVLAISIGVGACGDGDSTASNEPSSSIEPAAPSTSSAPNEPTSAAPSTDPDATALPGPRLPSATYVPPDKQDPTIVGQRCDTANGPEGALRVVIFPGGSANCAAVMPVAKKYGPMIATGRNQSVDGWNCGPSQTVGVLATCTRESDSFGFVPQWDQPTGRAYDPPRRQGLDDVGDSQPNKRMSWPERIDASG